MITAAITAAITAVITAGRDPRGGREARVRRDERSYARAEAAALAQLREKVEGGVWGDRERRGGAREDRSERRARERGREEGGREGGSDRKSERASERASERGGRKGARE